MTPWWKEINTSRPWTVVAVALAMIIGLGWYGSGLFDSLSQGSSGFDATGTLAEEADKSINAAFGPTEAADIILFERKNDSLGASDSENFQAAVDHLLEPLKEDSKQIVTYATSQNDALISRDKSSTYAIVTLNGDSDAVYSTLTKYQDDVDQSNIAVSIGGTTYGEHQTEEQVSQDLVRAELIAMPLLMILLLVFFRSVVAASIPLLVGVITVVGAFAISRLLGQFIDIDHYAVNVITILGLGLSIDYSLLMVNRFRENLTEVSVQEAVHRIVSTSGRTIFFSGLTVIVCLTALLFFPVDFLHSIAVGGMSAAAMAMLVTLLFLPAILQLLGKNINRWQIGRPKRLKRQAKNQHGVWTRIAHLSSRHPFQALAVGGVIIATMAVPVSQLKSAAFDHTWLARDTSSKYVGGVLASEYDSQSPSIDVLMTAYTAHADTIVDDYLDLIDKISQIESVASVQSATITPGSSSYATLQQLIANKQATPYILKTTDDRIPMSYGPVGSIRFSVTLKDEVNSARANQALKDIRALKPLYGEIQVGGMQAHTYDTDQAYLESAPRAIAVVFVAMFVLLSLLLRSVVLPIQAAIINSASLLISVGIIVVIFQFGWLTDLLGLSQTNGLMLSSILLVVAIAFGLAMDYSVFLYSRMREIYDKSNNHQKAIEDGIATTGPIITAAAFMFFVVVIAFASSSVAFMQIIGIGLGMAVLVDAFFVRLIVVPAVMKLTGKATWYAPKWLSRWSIRHE